MSGTRGQPVVIPDAACRFNIMTLAVDGGAVAAEKGSRSFRGENEEGYKPDGQTDSGREERKQRKQNK